MTSLPLSPSLGRAQRRERVAVTIMGGDTDPSAHEALELQAFRTPAHPVLSRLEPTDRSAWRG
jgi:hypothetical protein